MTSLGASFLYVLSLRARAERYGARRDRRKRYAPNSSRSPVVGNCSIIGVMMSAQPREAAIVLSGEHASPLAPLPFHDPL